MIRRQLFQLGRIFGRNSVWRGRPAVLHAQHHRRAALSKTWKEYVRRRPTCPACRCRLSKPPKTAEHCPECGEVIPF